MTAPMGGYMTPTPMDQFGRPVQQSQQQWGQPLPPQQGGYPQQQQMPQPPAQLQGLDLNARLSGQGIPQELQGRTVGEALRYYQVMREDFLARNSRPQQPLQGQPQQQQQQQPRGPGGQFGPYPQQPQQQQPQQQQQQLGSEAAMEQMVQAVVQRLAPAIAPLQQASASSVYQQARQRFPDWNQYDALIQEALQGADPQTLLDPRVWEAAYYHAKGRAATPGAIPQQMQQPQAWGQAPMQSGPPAHYGNGTGQPPAQYYGQAPQNFGQQPPPPSNYFVESPTPSAPMAPTMSNDPRDEVFARRAGVPLDQYRRDKARVLAGLEPEPLPGQVGYVAPAQPYPQQQFMPVPQQQGTQPWMTGNYPPQPNGGYRGY